MPSCLYNLDVAACRATLKANSKTFHAASLLLPARVRAPASVLYGFCRLADDAVDVDGGKVGAVDRLHQRLDRVYAGRPEPVAEDRALAAVVAEFGIPREMPDFLLEGLAWDVQGRRYETLEELLAYAARVAGAVGAMMSLLMGVREPAALARACELGVAMQLSNIARDVGEDARMGRLYLPRRWMTEAGLDPDAWLRRPQFDARLASVVTRLLAEAETLYARAGAGVAELPLSCRPGINAARFMYAEIGRELLRRGADSVSQRTVVPGRRKALLLLRAALALHPSKAALQVPSLQVNRPLIDAAVQTAPPACAAGPVRFVIDLFERLERRDQAPKGVIA
jgi:phytoene synthase